MDIVIYIAAATIGLALSGMGLMFALLSGTSFAFMIGALLVVAHVASVVFVRRKAAEGKGRQAAIVLALPLFAVMTVVYVVFVGGELLHVNEWF